jgi:hypothetical protein
MTRYHQLGVHDKKGPPLRTLRASLPKSPSNDAGGVPMIFLSAFISPQRYQADPP